MSEKADPTLTGVAETLLLPLYSRAMESMRPDAMIKDAKAEELVTHMRLDFSPVKQIRITEFLKVIRIILTRQIDRCARDFLMRHPEGVVVHIAAVGHDGGHRGESGLALEHVAGELVVAEAPFSS